MPTQKKSSRKTRAKRQQMHYTVVLMLGIVNAAMLGLAIVMAQFMGASMGNLAYIGAQKQIRASQARATRVLGVMYERRIDADIAQCEGRWSVCSEGCDAQYDNEELTDAGWEYCELECDYRLLACNNSGDWLDTVSLRDR